MKNTDVLVSGLSGKGRGTTGFQLPPVGGSWIPLPQLPNTRNTVGIF